MTATPRFGIRGKKSYEWVNNINRQRLLSLGCHRRNSTVVDGPFAYVFKECRQLMMLELSPLRQSADS